MNLTNFNYINNDIPPTKIIKEKYKIYERNNDKMYILNKFYDYN